MKKLFFALIVSFSFLIFSAFNDSTTNSTLNESRLSMSNQTIIVSNTSNSQNPWLVRPVIDGIPSDPPIAVGGPSRTFNVPGNSVDVDIEFQEVFGVTDPDGIAGSAYATYSQKIGELGKPICTKTYSYNTPSNDSYTFNCFTSPPGN